MGYLALANLKQGELKFGQACACLEQALNLELADAPLLCELGLEFGRVDRLDKAIALLRKSLAIAPGSGSTRVALAGRNSVGVLGGVTA